MIARRRQAPVRLAALLTLTAAVPAAAQLTDAGTPVRPPGWSVTPAIGVSEMWDDNPTLAAEGDVQHRRLRHRRAAEPGARLPRSPHHGAQRLRRHLRLLSRAERAEHARPSRQPRLHAPGDAPHPAVRARSGDAVADHRRRPGGQRDGAAPADDADERVQRRLRVPAGTPDHAQRRLRVAVDRVRQRTTTHGADQSHPAERRAAAGRTLARRHRRRCATVSTSVSRSAPTT